MCGCVCKCLCEAVSWYEQCIRLTMQLINCRCKGTVPWDFRPLFWIIKVGPHMNIQNGLLKFFVFVNVFAKGVCVLVVVDNAVNYFPFEKWLTYGKSNLKFNFNTGTGLLKNCLSALSFTTLIRYRRIRYITHKFRTFQSSLKRKISRNRFSLFLTDPDRVFWAKFSWHCLFQKYLLAS